MRERWQWVGRAGGFCLSNGKFRGLLHGAFEEMCACLHVLQIADQMLQWNVSNCKARGLLTGNPFAFIRLRWMQF
jgi:hypothetical protein